MDHDDRRVLEHVQRQFELLRRPDGDKRRVLADLFTGLNYRVLPHFPPPIANNEWSEAAREAISDETPYGPAIIAEGGGGTLNLESGESAQPGFKIIYVPIEPSEHADRRLLLTHERAIADQLLYDHRYPDCLLVFSDPSQQYWHFVNPRLILGGGGAGAGRRRYALHRISVSPDDELRTAIERFAMLALGDHEAETLTPQAIHDRHNEAFDVEAVTKEFFGTYRGLFASLQEEIVFTEDVDDETRHRYAQALFNRLLFVAFIQRKGWLDGDKDYLYQRFRTVSADGRDYYDDFLWWLFFWALPAAPEARSDAVEQVVLQRLGHVPFLNGGLFEMSDLDVHGGVSVPNSTFERIFHELLNRYNFTVAESTPLDIEVAVDPEMLGKVFEELIIERHERGSYYTPKTIVSFMCRETLKSHIALKCGAETRPAISLFVDEHDPSALRDPEDVLEALRSVTVCDPACGSGAYLLGMMQELMQLRTALFAANQLDDRTSHSRKLDIISRNIYGVDIDPVAVNIARLRLWLSLSVEFEGPVPRPLPNLDFKIETGDSLTGPAPGVDQSALREQLIDEFAQTKERFLIAHEQQAKRRLKAQVDALRRELAAWMHPGEEARGFDWAVQFAEVYRHRGFDIIVANPPYGAKAPARLRDALFPASDGQSRDVYGLFIARGLQLLRPNGVMSYIVSDTWRTIRTHLPLRSRILRQATVQHVMDLPPWVFDQVVNTCILTLERTVSEESHFLVAADLRAIPDRDWNLLEENLTAVADDGEDRQNTRFARYSYPQRAITSDLNHPFFIAAPSLHRFTTDAELPRLRDFADVKVGLQTGDNRRYIRAYPNAHGSYDPIDQSLILSRDQLMGLTAEEKRNGVNPSDYDGRHYIPYDKGGGSDAEGGWLPNYNIRPLYFIDWSRASVASLRQATTLGSRRAYIRNESFYFSPGLTFSDSGFYAPTFRLSAASVFDQKSSIIVPHDDGHLRPLLGILCSRLIRYVLKSYINHTVSTHVESIKAIPIVISDTHWSRIADLVQDIVAQQNLDARYPYHLHEQQQIDELVNDLYEVSDPEALEVDLWYCRHYPILAQAQGVHDTISHVASHLRT